MAAIRLRRTLRMLFAVALVGVLSYAIWAWATFEPDDPKARRVGPFLATPYIQLGENPEPDDLTLLWHADDVDASWSVDVQSPLESGWRPAGPPSHRRIILDDVEHHRVYRAVLSTLTPGERFRYRVKLDGAAAFRGSRHGPRSHPGQPHRFVAFGDSSKNSVGQRKVAYQTQLLKPDMVLITGDIVYFQGRIGEYRPKFFPIYAAAETSPRAGAPLLSYDPVRRRAGQPRPDGQRLSLATPT